jgi:hypothetical protein
VDVSAMASAAGAPGDTADSQSKCNTL